MFVSLVKGRDSIDSLMGNCVMANGGEGGEKGITVNFGWKKMFLYEFISVSRCGEMGW